MKMKLKATALTAIMLVAVSAQAAEITWNGSVDTDSQNTSNWDGGVLPGAADQLQGVTNVLRTKTFAVHPP